MKNDDDWKNSTSELLRVAAEKIALLEQSIDAVTDVMTPALTASAPALLALQQGKNKKDKDAAKKLFNQLLCCYSFGKGINADAWLMVWEVQSAQKLLREMQAVKSNAKME